MTYIPSPHFTQNSILSKPSARGRRGIVVSQVRSAAEAGVAILDAGGNAVDAAVATALALAAVEPWNSGLGGIGFALVHRAGQPMAEVVDFGPVAPRNLGTLNISADRTHEAGSVRVAGGRGRRKYSRSTLFRDPVFDGRIRPHARPMGEIAPSGGDLPRHRAR